MNKFELIGKFFAYAILGGLGMISSLVGYVKMYDDAGFLGAFIFFMINAYLMIRGITVIVEEEQS